MLTDRYPSNRPLLAEIQSRLSRYTPQFANFHSSESIDFLDEIDEDSAPQHALPAWLVLIVDDDLSVHEVTLLTLRASRIAGRPLAFLHAYSAHEAETLIASQPGIDLVLLDVVMETPDAGLRLIGTLNAKNKTGPCPRIVLRTGQAGKLNDEALRSQIRVDGYVQKLQQTRSLLLEVMESVLSKPSALERPN